MIKKSNATLASSLFLSVIVSFECHAELLDGGDFVTDTLTGLEWIKPVSLVGVSYQTALATANSRLSFDPNRPWRFARTDELSALFETYIGARNGLYSPIFPNSAASSAYYNAATSFVETFGILFAFNDSRASYNIVSLPWLRQISIQGFYDDGGQPDRVGLAEATATISNTNEPSSAPAGRWLIFADSQEMSRSGPNYGAWLVREGIIKVTVDIRPSSTENPVNLISAGVLPVAVLSSVSFDARTVNPSTVLLKPTLSGTGVPANGYSVEDVNADGKADIVFKFPIQNIGFSCGSSSGYLSGKTYEGKSFAGADKVTIVKQGQCAP